MSDINQLNHPSGEEFKPGNVLGILSLVCGLCSVLSLFLFLVIEGWCFVLSFSLSIASLILAKMQFKIYNGAFCKWGKKVGTMSLCLSIAAFLVYLIISIALGLLVKLLF